MLKKQKVLVVNIIIVVLAILNVILLCRQTRYIEDSIGISKEEDYKLSRDISEFYTNVVTESHANMYRQYKYVPHNKKVIPEPAEVTLEPADLYSDDDKYYLAKIVMCEASNQSKKTKMLVVAVILNRVESESFPDSIQEVICQNNGRTYQFSPLIPEDKNGVIGSWYYLEPDEECYEAVNAVLNAKYDDSDGALYFESFNSYEDTNNWHSQHLTYLYQSDDLRFYK